MKNNDLKSTSGKWVLIYVRFNPELGRLEYACEYGIEGWWIFIPRVANDESG